MLLETFILLAVSIYGAGLLFSAVKGAPYVPTSKKELDKILRGVPLKKNASFVELGSGDGRMVRYAVKQYNQIGVGIEINPLLVGWSNYLAKKEGISKNVTFLKKNIFDYSLKNVDYLYLFLMPDLLSSLTPKFKKELKKGTVIISHGFKLPEFKSHLIHTIPEKAFSTYYYKI